MRRYSIVTRGCFDRVPRSLGQRELFLPGVVDEEDGAAAAGHAAATLLRELGCQVAGWDGDEAVLQAVVVAILPQPRLADVVGGGGAVVGDRERTEAAGHLAQILADHLAGCPTDDHASVRLKPGFRGR